MNALVTAVAQVVELLVGGQWDSLERLTAGRRLGAEQIEAAVRDYGRTLVTPPRPDFADQLEIIGVVACEVPRFAVLTSLWTREEGRSDLSVELTLTSTGDGYRIEIDNIRVL
ncbi:MAG TPA: hypothetical protein VGH89_27040 [Pseudonocardia sp.]|jgi:hypothetical protein